MRLSDLLGTEVRDGNNRVLGVVRDARATVDEDQGGRLRELRLHGILVAPKRRPWPRMEQPLLVGWLERRFEASSRYVVWDSIESIEPGVIRVRASG